MGKKLSQEEYEKRVKDRVGDRYSVVGEYKGKEMMVNKGLDYYHCKGCLRCVDVCPVNALVRGNEAEYENKPYFIPNKELLRKPKYYLPSGADGYITSESFLTEERMEGGEV